MIRYAVADINVRSHFRSAIYTTFGGKLCNFAEDMVVIPPFACGRLHLRTA
jgi:hypothetical protein